MTAGAWLVGLSSLLVVLAAVAMGGHELRRRLLPDASGAAAALATWTCGYVPLIAVLQLEGAIALFRRSVIVLTAAVVVVLCGLRRRARGQRLHLAAPGIGLRQLPWVLAVIAVGALWLAHAAHAVRWGVDEYDSLDYALPLAVKFVQTHRLGPLHLVTPGAPTAYYPQGGLVEQGTAMALLGRDLLAPVLTVIDLALLLLSSAVIGRRWAVGRITMLAGCVVAGLPAIVATNAGSAKDDVAATAWVVAAIALLSQALPDRRGEEWQRGWLAPAGLALGMAADTKLTALPAVVMVVLSLLVLLGREGRRATPVVVLAALPVSAFWYVRDLIVVGTPAPSVSLGPLPHADFSLVDEYGRSLARAAVSTPGDLREHELSLFYVVLTVAWPLLVALVAAGVIAGLAGLRRSSPPLLGVLGVVGAGALVGYVVTPVTGGPVNDPSHLAVSNTRYAATGFVIALIALTIAVRGDARARAAVTALLAVMLGFEVLEPWRGAGHDPTGRPWVVAVMGLGAIAVVLAVGARIAGRLAPGLRGVAAVVLVVLVFVGGLPVVRAALRHRYGPGSQGSTVWAALADVRGARVAVVGGPQKHPLAGTTLDNVVDEIGTHTPHGGLEVPTSCAEVAQALAGRDYGYLYFGQSELTQHAGVTAATFAPLAVGAPVVAYGTDVLYRLRAEVTGVPGCS